jgi:peptidoglycan/xylan/chitin deacetylase (PgdA/CDA1 family)
MGARRTLGMGRVRVPVAVLAALVVAVVFVGAAAARLDSPTLGAVALLAGALAGGALVTGAAVQTGSMRVVGLVIAVVAVWLVEQRADAGTIAVLAAFAGAGLALLAGPLRPGDPTPAERRGHRAVGAALLAGVLVVTAYVGAETPTVSWFGGGATHGSTARREVALTFDDGPNVTATLPIMQILDDAQVKATFFEVGRAIDAAPDITRALYEHGQLLGNHSYHHDQWRWLDPWYPELDRTQQAFVRTIGRCPGFFRPPHGERTPFLAHVVRDHHLRMVLWNDSAHDWDEDDPRVIARRIVRKAGPGSIIVLHDGLDGDPTADRTVLVRALPLILDGLREKDLRVVGLDRLLGAPAYVPC